MNELLSKLGRFGIVWIAAVFLMQVPAAAQGTLLSGKVVDTDGAPVIGAGIVSVEKKSSGTITDLDGKFSFKIPVGTQSVLFSSVGMKDVVYKIVPGKTDGITIVMEWESTQLDQVVVTGYAQTTVKRITGSVAVIGSDKFEAKAISSVDALMQGEIAGVAVSATSGQPGTQSRIRIRGANNLSGTSQPLWVVDGVPMQSDSPSLSSEQLATGGFDDIFVNGIGNINPNDIESITILKDAAAAAVTISSCQKDDKPTVEFEKSLYTAYAKRSVDVKVILSEPATENVSVMINSSGANAGTDFELTGVPVTIKAGETSGTFSVKNLNLTQASPLNLGIECPSGYDLGTKFVTIVAPDPEETLVYSFELTKADVVGPYVAKIKVTGA